MSQGTRVASSGRRSRRDAELNRRRLLEAASELMASAAAEVEPAMAEVAERAGLSVATAYRYFPSFDDLRRAVYIRDVAVQMRDRSHDCKKTGQGLFEEVVGEWVRLVHTYGPLMVRLRSHRGYLARLSEGDEALSTIRDAMERPIRSVMRHLHVADEHFLYALFLYNVMFDPREVLDLAEAGWEDTDLVRRLASAYYGALTGWAASTSN